MIGGRSKDDSMEMRWSPMIGVSFTLHLIVFSIILFVPKSFPTKAFDGVVYEVNLVELPAGEAVKPTDKGAPVRDKGKTGFKKATPAKRIEVTKKEQKPPLVIAKRTIQKEASVPRKPEVSSSKLIDRAISKIERKVESEKSDHLSSALSKLASQVKGGTASETPSGRGATGTMMQIYQMEVEEWVKSNWSYPVALENKKGLEARVLLLVKRDGSISSTKFIKRSSNAIFDQSVSRAIQRSDPLPPFPEGYIRSSDEIEINFNLKELETR